MMLRSKTTLAFTMGTVAMMLAGTAQAKDTKIGMVNLTLCCAYFVGMDASVKDQAETYQNVKVFSTDAKGDVAKLTSDVEDLLSKGVDALVISGAAIEAAPAALDAAAKAKVPVVMVDRLLKGGAYASWVGPDNRAIGMGIGDYIVKRLQGKGKLVMLRGGPADNSIGINRTEGVQAKVKNSQIEVVVAPGWGGWSADGGFKLMEDMLAKNPHIDAVFCENDSMCLGAQKAISDAGRSKEMFITSVDGEKGALAEIKKAGGNYAATGLNSADQIGRAGLDRVMAVLDKKTFEKDTVMPSPIITIDNVSQYYSDESKF